MKHYLSLIRPSSVLLLLALVGSLLTPAYRVQAQKDTPPSKPTETAQEPKVETQGDGSKKGVGPDMGPRRTAPVRIMGAFDVGVIPATRSCPANSEAITIFMDDEDSNNINGRGGWTGAFLSNRDTSFFFCRIDGQLLRPLTSQFTQTQYHYAVLKLGSACPNNSLDFVRGFDNEDKNNINSSSGNIFPNTSDINTTLRFCLFRSDAVTMSSFPSLGFSYGVFAASSFSSSFRLASGFVFTDDEDNRNANSYSANSAWLADAQRIVLPGRDTRLNLVQVVR